MHQAVWRQRVACRDYLKARQGTILMQASYRGQVERARVKKMQHAAAMLQSAVRRHLARKEVGGPVFALSGAWCVPHVPGSDRGDCMHGVLLSFACVCVRVYLCMCICACILERVYVCMCILA